MNIQTRHLNDLLQFGNTSSNSPACKERFASYDLKTRLENAMKLFLRTFSSKEISDHASLGKRSERHPHPSNYV